MPTRDIILTHKICSYCGIEKPLSEYHIDRNAHTRVKVVSRCNAGLGYFCDNTDYLDSAIAYLNKWK